MSSRIGKWNGSNPTVIKNVHITHSYCLISCMNVLNYSWIRILSTFDPQPHHLDIESRKNFVIPLSIAEIISIMFASDSNQLRKGINIIEIISAMERGITKFFLDSISR